MDRLIVIAVLFVVAGLCEIRGGYLVGGWIRENRHLMWAALGAVVLAAYGVVAALQPIPEFGRVYATYGSAFIDGFRPDRYDLLGALLMVAPPRS